MKNFQYFDSLENCGRCYRIDEWDHHPDLDDPDPGDVLAIRNIWHNCTNTAGDWINSKSPHCHTCLKKIPDEVLFMFRMLSF